MASRRQRRKSPGSGGTPTPLAQLPGSRLDQRRPAASARLGGGESHVHNPLKRPSASARPYGATDRKGCWTRARWLRVAPTAWPCGALGHVYPHLVALDADVRNSTYSETLLHDEELRERFFECRIAEQNHAVVRRGYAADGKLPFVSTFGKFLVRAYDQLEMGLISRFSLKLVGSHVGVSLAADGPSQMALPDDGFLPGLDHSPYP